MKDKAKKTKVDVKKTEKAKKEAKVQPRDPGNWDI